MLKYVNPEIRKLFFLFLLLPLLNSASGKAFASPPSPRDSILQTLRKEHPRLMASAQDFEKLKNLLATDAEFKQRYAALAKKGDEIVKQPVSNYEIPDGLRLLTTSRRVLDRIFALAFLYKVGGDTKYADRAWQELETAAKFPDWNPKHFLDTGEMTYAFAIGYDWLFDYWNPDQKQLIRHAIVEHGLNRAVLAYEGLALNNMSWWVTAEHNWNQVCHGGMGVGALAIADEESRLAEYILKNVVKYLPLAMKHYGPDGAWNEGPGYWAYATKYNVAILASLESAVGKDFGLSQIEGFSKTALYPIYVTGPINKSFNYADGGDGKIGGSSMAWLARKYQHPFIAQYQRQQGGSDPLDLLWNSYPIEKTKAQEIPLDVYFRDAEVVTMRSKWDDKNALFVGFKAGDNAANHSNLDLGSFVLDGLGQRWILDLGAENYSLPNYFNAGRNGKRWNYYRMRAESHNTLVLNPGVGPDQDPVAKTTISKFKTNATNAFAIADLTSAYAENANSVKRGIALAERKRIIISDEVSTKKPADLYWFVHTPASVAISGNSRTAILTLNGEQMQATIISPATAKFTVGMAKPLPASPQPDGINPNKGISRLAINLKNISEEKIVVEFKPAKEKSRYKGNFLKPLASWQ